MGREFYVCPKPIDIQCQVLLWDDLKKVVGPEQLF